MIQSMTGFGKSSLDFSNKKINIQLRSLNSKRLDIYTRMPSEYRQKELVLHKMIGDKLIRGKIDFSLHIENALEEGVNKLNKAVIQAYIKDLKSLVSDKEDRKSTRLNSSHVAISYAVFCLKKKKE